MPCGPINHFWNPVKEDLKSEIADLSERKQRYEDSLRKARTVTNCLERVLNGNQSVVSFLEKELSEIERSLSSAAKSLSHLERKSDKTSG